MRIAISIVAVIGMWVVAKRKGLNPWLWFLAAGIPGSGYPFDSGGPNILWLVRLVCTRRRGISRQPESSGEPVNVKRETGQPGNRGVEERSLFFQVVQVVLAEFLCERIWVIVRRSVILTTRKCRPLSLRFFFAAYD